MINIKHGHCLLIHGKSVFFGTYWTSRGSGTKSTNLGKSRIRIPNPEFTLAKMKCFTVYYITCLIIAGIRKYVCEICGKKSLTSGIHASHMLTHRSVCSLYSLLTHYVYFYSLLIVFFSYYPFSPLPQILLLPIPSFRCSLLVCGNKSLTSRMHYSQTTRIVK